MPEMHQILVALDVNMARHVCQHLVRRLVPYLDPRLVPSLLHPIFRMGQGNRSGTKPGIIEILSNGSKVPEEHQPKLMVILQLEHFGPAGLLQGAPEQGRVLPCDRVKPRHRVLKLWGWNRGVQDDGHAVIIHAYLLLAGEV